MRFFLITILFPFSLFGQQEPLSAFFWNNYSHINPATSGIRWGHEFNATYRDQWTGVDGAPLTLFGNYNTIVADKHGAGLNYSFEKIGNSKIHKGLINYNYQFRNPTSAHSERKISLGLSAGVLNYSHVQNWVCPTCDPLPTWKPVLEETSLIFNGGVAYHRNGLLAGISVSQLSPEIEKRFYEPAPHLNVHFRYPYRVSRQAFLLLETLGRTDFVKWTADVSARYFYKDSWEFGLGYRWKDMLGANVSWAYKQRYRIGYAFEYKLSPLSSYSNGTHEVQLRYTIF